MLTLFLSPFVVLALLSVTAACSYAASDSLPDVSGQEWQEFLTVRDVNRLSAPRWCGKNGILVKGWTQELRHVDLNKRRASTVTKWPLRSQPFCDNTGDLVFLEKMLRGGAEEGYRKKRLNDGIWVKDLRSKKTIKLGYFDNELFPSPASPTSKTYVVVGHASSQNAARVKKTLMSKLPGWQILTATFEPNEFILHETARWARDGSYFVLPGLDANARQDRYRFFDGNGAPIAEIAVASFPYLHTKAMNDGLYACSSNRAIKKLNHKTGIVVEDFFVFPSRAVSFNCTGRDFDIAPSGTVVLAENGIWISASPQPVQVSSTGRFPQFSSTGEYLAYVRPDVTSGDKAVLVILKRVKN